MKLVLFDINEKMCNAWEKEFENYNNVEIINHSLEKLENIDYMVTAGNSYGWMTGGIDLAVRNYLGISFQDNLQSRIINEYSGILPVGEFIILRINKENIKNIVYVPTMTMPKAIKPIEVFYVFYKVIDTFMDEYYSNKTLACCGLGTSTGRIPYETVAKTMKDAYDYCLYSREEEQLKRELYKGKNIL